MLEICCLPYLYFLMPAAFSCSLNCILPSKEEDLKDTEDIERMYLLNSVQFLLTSTMTILCNYFRDVKSVLQSVEIAQKISKQFSLQCVSVPIALSPRTLSFDVM